MYVCIYIDEYREKMNREEKRTVVGRRIGKEHLACPFPAQISYHRGWVGFLAFLQLFFLIYGSGAVLVFCFFFNCFFLMNKRGQE